MLENKLFNISIKSTKIYKIHVMFLEIKIKIFGWYEK